MTYDSFYRKLGYKDTSSRWMNLPDINTPKYMVEFNKFMRGQASRHFSKLEYLPLTGAFICDRDRLQVSVHETIELWWQSYCETQAIIKTRKGPVTVTPEQEQRARELQFDKKVSRLVQLMMIYEEVIQEEFASEEVSSFDKVVDQKEDEEMRSPPLSLLTCLDSEEAAFMADDEQYEPVSPSPMPRAKRHKRTPYKLNTRHNNQKAKAATSVERLPITFTKSTHKYMTKEWWQLYHKTRVNSILRMQMKKSYWYLSGRGHTDESADEFENTDGDEDGDAVSGAAASLPVQPVVVKKAKVSESPVSKKRKWTLPMR